MIPIIGNFLSFEDRLTMSTASKELRNTGNQKLRFVLGESVSQFINDLEFRKNVRTDWKNITLALDYSQSEKYLSSPVFRDYSRDCSFKDAISRDKDSGGTIES